MPSKPLPSASKLPAASTLSPDPLLETQVFWTQYKTSIILGLILALCLLAGIGGYRLYTAQRDSAAAALFASAKTPAEYQKVIADYPASGAAASASLLLAESQRKDQKFADANATLQAFITRDPKHELVGTARMAMAANLESLGKPEDALTLYRRVAAEGPRNFTAPLAMLAQVPLLQQKGQIEEARRVCETVLTQYRESYAAQEASVLLRTLKPKAAPAVPAQAHTPVPSVAPAP